MINNNSNRIAAILLLDAAAKLLTKIEPTLARELLDHCASTLVPGGDGPGAIAMAKRALEHSIRESQDS